MNEFSDQILQPGPLGFKENLDLVTVKSKIKEVMRLVSYIKIAKRDKLKTRFFETKMYDDLFTTEEVKDLIENVPNYWIDPAKCTACTICAKRSPVDAIEGDKGIIHVIDQQKCIKCGTRYNACPDKFKALQRLVNMQISVPLPFDARQKIRKVENVKGI